jgi:hypothetical protein
MAGKAACTDLDSVAAGARSAEPGEDWSWCYVDEVAFVVAPD